jgi:hypothetical protein
MLTTHHIEKGFAAALMLALIGSVPALAKPMWGPPASIAYLEYDLTPYFDLMMGSSPTYQYWRPNSAVESSPYRGLFYNQKYFQSIAAQVSDFAKTHTNMTSVCD